MFDPIFEWLESTRFTLWMIESPSLLAFPGILTVHTIGLGLLAGPSAVIAMRQLGAAPGIPVASLARLAPVMWTGLWLNLLSGIALVLAYPTKALTNPVFYGKLLLIAVSLLILRTLLAHLRAGAPPSPRLKTFAVVQLVCWGATITAGRFLAYTCTRLLVNLPCS